MKMLIGWPISWTLYGIGCLACHYVDHDTDDPWHWWDHVAYGIYSWSMVSSSRVQDWYTETGPGPWRPAEP